MHYAHIGILDIEYVHFSVPSSFGQCLCRRIQNAPLHTCRALRSPEADILAECTTARKGYSTVCTIVCTIVHWTVHLMRIYTHALQLRIKPSSVRYLR